MVELIKKLNEQQAEAVLATKGPVMVMAGAGSGKTRVLTHRIAHLIMNEGVYPSQILAVTFTNKAATEMKVRLASLMENTIDTNRMWVSTFHAICAKILRYDIAALGHYDSKFRILDTDEVISVIKGIMKELEYNPETLKPKAAAGYISNMKNLPDYEYPFNLKSMLVRIEMLYKQKLQRENLVDFDDLILLALKLFQDNKGILEKYQDKFRYIMIDEFQDTNTTQYKLIKLLGMKNRNVFVVGDQDQSIYAFRGAVLGNVDTFLDDFKDTKVILLEQNYRSTSEILALANDIINQNPNRIKKSLFSQKEGGDLPSVKKLDNQYEEARFVTNKIKEFKTKGYLNKDFAILYRANHLSRTFEESLVRAQVPFVIYGGMAFFNRMEIKDITAYITLVTNFNDNYSFLRIVNTPRRKIGPAMLEKLTSIAEERSISLFDAIDYITFTSTAFKDFKNMIIKLRETISRVPLESVLDIILKETGYEAYLKAMGDEGIPRLENVHEFKSVIVESEENFQGENLEILSQLVSDIALRTNMDDIDEDDNKVKLMTYHQAKGLEFKIVFMVAMEEGIFPSAYSSDSELEEERRVCYVGVTRAEEKLFLTHASSRMMFGNIKTPIQSRFIRNSEYIEYDKPAVSSSATSDYTSFMNPHIKKKTSPVEGRNVVSPSDFKVGEKVTHTVFGDGVVLKINEKNIEIAFGVEFGPKILNPNIAALKKIN